MNIIMAGCEFAGKTTLADLIVEWCAHNLGSSSHFHDHFTIPSSELTGQASGEVQGRPPPDQGDAPALHDLLPRL